jgi:Leucine-rich repeat (LRR) protein
MNNLAHDLARSVAGEDILVILDAENERCNRNYDYRYAQVSASSLQSIDSKAWPSKARSLIFRTSGAELQHVSEVLSVNKYLRVLDISGCSVKEMPTPVFQLNQLRYLDASTLPVADLPPQISGFHKLQTLDLSDTEVTELPAFIANLKRLNYLNLQGCKKLQRLNNLDLLHELHYLNLSCCPEVRSFPASLENLRKLRFFNLSKCSKLPTLPDELLQSFSSFSSIVDLNLSGFEFPMLPDFFGNICSLQFLSLSKCSKLELLPQSFGQLAYLKGLNLSFCSDLKLPDSFEYLTSLQFLNLSHCPSVEYLPSSFDRLSNLEYLNLSRCVGLKALPKSLSNHKNLRIEVLGCQDCIVQSCSLSSQSHTCSQQVKEVGSSSSIDTILKEPANRDVAVGISFSDNDEVGYPQNKLKQKSASSYHMDGHKSEEPNFINKVKVQYISYVCFYKIVIAQK